MFKNLRLKIEGRRGSENLFWKLLVFMKDFFWRILVLCHRITPPKLYLFRVLYSLGISSIRLTVKNTIYLGFGDTILTGNICRIIKKRFKKVKINCITGHPELLKFNPYIDCINQKETFFSVTMDYIDMELPRSAARNVLKSTLNKLGIKKYEYKSEIYLSEKELKDGRLLLKNINRPIIIISTKCGTGDNTTKEWFENRWQQLINKLYWQYSIVQLGDNREPEFKNVIRFAGELPLRKSLAVLSYAKLHIGIVGFMMHAASGLNVPSVIIYGGRETPQNSGYATNKNIYIKTPCSPCWKIVCYNNRKCLEAITPEMVFKKVQEFFKNAGR